MADEVTYDVADRAAIAGMTGIEMLRAMIAGLLPAPPIARGLNFRLIEVEEGRALFEGMPGPEHRNPLGGVHGGWPLTLIDSAAGCALHTMMPAGVGYTTVETKANFTRPLTPGKTYRCEGRVISRGRQIALSEATLTAPDGKVCAHGTSTLIILPPRD